MLGFECHNCGFLFMKSGEEFISSGAICPKCKTPFSSTESSKPFSPINTKKTVSFSEQETLDLMFAVERDCQTVSGYIRKAVREKIQKSFKQALNSEMTEFHACIEKTSSIRPEIVLRAKYKGGSDGKSQ